MSDWRRTSQLRDLAVTWDRPSLDNEWSGVISPYISPEGFKGGWPGYERATKGSPRPTPAPPQGLPYYGVDSMTAEDDIMAWMSL